MAKYTFLDLAEEVLKKSSTPLDASTIWRQGGTHGYIEKVGSQGKTPSMSLSARLYVDSKDNKNSRFIRTNKNPVLFGLRGIHSIKQLDEAVLKAVTLEKPPKLLERSLHPLVAFFAKLYLDDVYVKTIYHEKSLKKSFNEWLHPDLVGVRFPELVPEAQALAITVGELPLRLFSFELKRSLNFTNLRESFFQAVSNSSWAHQGYLVAADIKENGDFLKELKRLSGSFGIGVISLDVDNPDDSAVLYPAAERETLDWDSINKLAAENTDFAHFLRDVRIDLDGKKVHPAEYDKFEADVDKLKASMTSAQKQ